MCAALVHCCSVIRWHHQFLGALLPIFPGGRVPGGWWCHLRSGTKPTRSNKCMTEQRFPDQEDLGRGLPNTKTRHRDRHRHTRAAPSLDQDEHTQNTKKAAVRHGTRVLLCQALRSVLQCFLSVFHVMLSTPSRPPGYDQV